MYRPGSLYGLSTVVPALLNQKAHIEREWIRIDILKLAALLVIVTGLLSMHAAIAQTEDLGDGYQHHGVATPVSTDRGIVATVDGDGTPVALVWLYDHRAGYALLMIDATTGETQQFPTPWEGTWWAPFSSLLASNNCYYTLFGNHFVECFCYISVVKPVIPVKKRTCSVQ